MQSRWNGELKKRRLDARIARDFQNRTMYDDLDAQSVDDTYLRKRFREICINMKASIGQDQGYVLTYAYAIWLSSSEQATGERIRILKQVIAARQSWRSTQRSPLLVSLH